MLTRLSNDVGSLTIVNPSLEKIERISKLDGIYTLYPLGGAMGQNAFKNIVYSALDSIKGAQYDGNLAKINKDLALCFEAVHRPTSLEIADRAVNSLASLDLAIVLSIYRKLRNSAQKTRKVFYNFDDFRIRDYVSALSFSPTPSQMQAFEDIIADMKSDGYMSRIVSGDVGSGKTAVAFLHYALRQKAESKRLSWRPLKFLPHSTQRSLVMSQKQWVFAIACLRVPARKAKERKFLRGLKTDIINALSARIHSYRTTSNTKISHLPSLTNSIDSESTTEQNSNKRALATF